MNFPFQELAPSFHLVLLSLLAVLSLFVSWWSYRNLQSLPAGTRFVLTSLRASALLLLIMLLLNPLFQRTLIEDFPQKAVLYLDNSESMSVLKRDYQGMDSYRVLLQSLLELRPDEIDLDIFQFGSVLKSVEAPPNPDLAEKVSDFGQVFGHIERHQHDYRAAILFTDGIVTQGRDPAFQSRGLSVPVFSVPVGDPNPARDLQIRDVHYREQVPLNSEQTVRVELFQSGYNGRETVLRFFRNGELQERRTIRFEQAARVEEEFDLLHETEGVDEIGFELEPLEDELTDENNSQSIGIDVMDQRLVVWHLSYRIHPDTGYLRRLLERNSRIELEPYTWITDRYIEGELPVADNDSVDLIIMDGHPPEESLDDPSVFNTIPSIHIYPGSENALSPAPGLSRHPIATMGAVQGRPAVTTRFHPISDIGMEPTGRFPQLAGPRFGREGPGFTETLLTFEGTGSPLLLVEEADAVRRAHLFASGWYRYALSESESIRDFSARLLTNMIYWTAASPSQNLLEIAVNRSEVREGEPVLFRADVNRQTGYRASDISVYLTLQGSQDDVQRYRMPETGTDHFELDLTGLGPGTYRYTASLQQVDGTEIETEGQDILTVQPLSAEWFETVRNDSLLALISRQTGGQLVPSDRLSEIWDRLSEMDSETTSIQRTETWSPIASPWWLMGIILLLLAEWILRRYRSLP